MKKATKLLIALPLIMFVSAIAGHNYYGEQPLTTASVMAQGPLPSPDPPPVPTPPKVEPDPVQTFIITTDESRFPITLEMINGQPVRCVRFKIGDVPCFGVNGAGERQVEWKALPPSPNFKKHDVEGKIGHEATFGSPTIVNTAVFASVASDDGKASFSDVILVIAEGVGPTPPGPAPGPTPDPTPGPTPGPTPTDEAPIKKNGLYVMILFETETVQKLTEDQQVLLGSTKFRTFLDQNCVKAENGKSAYMIVDQNQVIGDDSVLQAFRDAAKLKPELGARIIVSNGKTGTIVPLPANVDEAIALVTKYKL